MRARLEAANPQAVAAIRDSVDEVATALQQDARKTSRPYATALRDAKRCFNVKQFTESNVHAPAHAQEFSRTVIALVKLGRFSADLVERALLDKGDDMLLILAKAAGCTWTTVKMLLLMFAAERGLKPEDLNRSLERYNRLTPETARCIIDFYVQRARSRTQATRETRLVPGTQP